MSRLPSNIVKKCWTIDLKSCYFLNESTQEEAFGMQHNPFAPKVSKVSKSQISDLCHLMALPCNGYKLNLLTSASMCHMALNLKKYSNLNYLYSC